MISTAGLFVPKNSELVNRLVGSEGQVGIATFSEVLAEKNPDYSKIVVFYEWDDKFICFIENPGDYLLMLRRYAGVISPDCSVCPGMPMWMQNRQMWTNIRLAEFLVQNGITVIPNVRFGDFRTYDISFSIVKSGSVLAVGSLGTLRNRKDRKCFQTGLMHLVERKRPPLIFVYGDTPSDIFEPIRQRGIEVVPLVSRIALRLRKRGQYGRK